MHLYAYQYPFETETHPQWRYGKHFVIFGASTPVFQGVGLGKAMQRKVIDEEYERLMATSSKTRFCGGHHTLTDPLQKGLHFTDLKLPPRHSKQDINLLGYDKVMYQGSVPVTKSGELPYDVDPSSVNVDELLDLQSMSFGPLPPRDASTPRYCGGSHTTTEPLQKGVKFAPFRLSEDPYRRDIGLRGKDGASYEGSDDMTPTDIDTPLTSQVPSSTSTRTTTGSRQNLVPSVVSLHVDSHPEVEGSTMSRPFQGCFLEIPANQLQRGNKPKTIGGPHYVPPQFDGKNKKPEPK